MPFVFKQTAPSFRTNSTGSAFLPLNLQCIGSQELPRQLLLDMGHPWIYDDEVKNISQLNGVAAGTLVAWLQKRFKKWVVNRGVIVVK